MTKITNIVYITIDYCQPQGFHICGITLLSGPPHNTILVGAAHCYTVGDNPSNYEVIKITNPISIRQSQYCPVVTS